MMDKPLTRLLGQWLLLALGTAFAAWIVPGIEATGGLVALLGASAILALLNLVLKPLLVLFTLPFVVLTFGVGLWVINALLFLLVGELMPGFTVGSFLSALGGSLVLSLVLVLPQLVLTRWKIRRLHQRQPGVTFHRSYHFRQRGQSAETRQPEREVIDI